MKKCIALALMICAGGSTLLAMDSGSFIVQLNQKIILLDRVVKGDLYQKQLAHCRDMAKRLNNQPALQKLAELDKTFLGLQLMAQQCLEIRAVKQWKESITNSMFSQSLFTTTIDQSKFKDLDTFVEYFNDFEEKLSTLNQKLVFMVTEKKG